MTARPAYDLSTGKQLFAGKDGNSRALYNSYKKGFQPRIGLAWTPDRFHGKTVIRTAWGVLNYLESTGTNRRLTMNPPYVYDFFLAYDNRFIGQKIIRRIPGVRSRSGSGRRPSERQHPRLAGRAQARDYPAVELDAGTPVRQRSDRVGRVCRVRTPATWSSRTASGRSRS